MWFVTMIHLWAIKMKPSTSSLGSTRPFEIPFYLGFGFSFFGSFINLVSLPFRRVTFIAL